MKKVKKAASVAVGAVVGIATFNPAAGFKAGLATYGVANMVAPDKKHKGNSTSPTYSFGPPATQSNNCLGIPLIYGRVKQAGNIIYNANATPEVNYRLIAFGFGPIDGFEDIRINDRPWSDYTAYIGDGVQQIDPRVEIATQEGRAEKAGGLKHIAYIANTAIASQFVDASYTLTAMVNGRKVRIYTDVNNHTVSYSTNPAWCILDFFTNFNGLALSHDLMDIQSFIEAAIYCDEVITTEGTGTVSITSGNSTVTGSDTKFLTELQVGSIIVISGEERTIYSITSDTSLTVSSNFSTTGNGLSYSLKQERFKLNYVIDTRDSNRNHLQDLLKTCNGFYYTMGGKHSIRIEKAEPSVQVFDETNIIADSENFETLNREDSWDVFKLQYIDPANEDAKVYAIAEASPIENNPPIIYEMEAYGITNSNQARRIANFALRKAKNCKLFYNFTATKEGLDRTVGDIITSNSPTYGWTNKLFRIESIQEREDGNYDIKTRVYDETIYDDSVSAGGPSINVSLLEDVSLSPSGLNYFSANQNSNLVQFHWQEINGTNITYEIREGTSWENSSIVASKITGNSHTSVLETRGSLNYWIKAKNKYGNYSDVAMQAILVVDSIPFRNVVVTSDFLEGTLAHSNTYKMTNGYVTLASNTLWINLSGLNWSDISNKYWGDFSVVQGTVTGEINDLGGIYTSIISLYYNINSLDNDVHVLNEVRASNDNTIWSTWEAFVPGEYTFRYYQFRMTIYSPNGKYAILENWKAVIDVPDRNEVYTDKAITVANDGVTIYFASDSQSIHKRDFVAPPAIVANITNNISGYTVITAKSVSSCTVKAYDNTGAAITANVDINVKGY